jgi:hypothetical protein
MMTRLALAFAILALTTSAAQTHVRHYPAPRHRVTFHHRRPPRRLHLSAEMRDTNRQASAGSRAALRQDGYMNPYVTRGLGKGAYASFGVQNDAVRPPAQPLELNGAANARLTHSESPAGVRVGIPF